MGGAGILFIPEGIGKGAGMKDDDEFLAVLTKAMTEPITDPGRASATLPYIIRAPAGAIGAIKHISFDDPWAALIDAP